MLLLFKVSSVILFCITSFFNVPLNNTNNYTNTIIDKLKINTLEKEYKKYFKKEIKTYEDKTKIDEKEKATNGTKSVRSTIYYYNDTYSSFNIGIYNTSSATNQPLNTLTYNNFTVNQTDQTTAGQISIGSSTNYTYIKVPKNNSNLNLYYTLLYDVYEYNDITALATATLEETNYNYYTFYNTSSSYRTLTLKFIFTPITYNITYNLTHVTSSNTATTINSTTTYYGTFLTADNGYGITNVSVTGNATYGFTPSTGELIVSSITGDFTINATATLNVNTYSITYNLTHVTSSNTQTTITSTTPNYSTILTANTGYRISSVSVTGNATGSFTEASGLLTVSSITGNFTINATATLIVNTYNITYNLTHITSSNTATTITSNTTNYRTFLTPDNGYSITSVSVTGNATGSFTESTGELIVNSITGDFTINATATLIVNTYNITYNLTHVTSSNTATTINSTTTYYGTFLTADNGYGITNVSVTGNATYGFTPSTGELIVSSITGDFTINATANVLQYTISYNLTNCTSSNTATTITYTQTYTTTLIANNGYILPTSIQVENANYNYNNTTGNLTISNPTGHVTITATATINLPQRQQLFTLSLTSNYTTNLGRFYLTNYNHQNVILADEYIINGQRVILLENVGSTYKGTINQPLNSLGANSQSRPYDLILNWTSSQELNELNYKINIAYYDINTSNYKTKTITTLAIYSGYENLGYTYRIELNNLMLPNEWDYYYISNITIQQLNFNPIAENLGINLLELFTPFLTINIASITIASLFIIILALWLWRWLKHL